MTTRQILLKAAKLVEKGWTQGGLARLSTGVEVGPHHAQACSWCAVGAIYKAAGFEPVSKVLAVIEDKLLDGQSSIPAWNDAPGRTQSEVAAMLRKAARAAK